MSLIVKAVFVLLVLTLVNGFSQGPPKNLNGVKIDQLLTEVSDLQKKFDSFFTRPTSSPAPSPGFAGKCITESSCAEILKKNPKASSGDYLLKDQAGQIKTVYCDMTRSCGGVTGGWMRVGFFDMTESGQRCPESLKMRDVTNVRTCTPVPETPGCSSVFFPSNSIKYSKICGKIKGYYGSTLDGFSNTGRGTSLNLDQNYVDGVSLTHGESPREHIWTFTTTLGTNCGPVPNYVGNDYFCDKGTVGAYNYDQPMWDASCPGGNYCQVNNPPWFFRDLSQPTTDNIEMRLCRDQGRGDEDVLLERVEIYIQ